MPTTVVTPLLSVSQAQHRILDHARAMPPERVALTGAFGRVLAEDVRARRDAPPWDNSAMDGYAVRAADVADGADLPVALDVPAGSSPDLELAAGAAARIMTGAPLPRGADAVAPVETTAGPAGEGRFAEVGERVRLLAAPAVGDHVRRRGEDVARGAVAVPAGAVCGGPEIAMAGAVGHAALSVHRRPRVAILPTGDELVDVDQAQRLDRIVNGNAYGIAAQVLEAGGDPILQPIVADDPLATRDAVAAALSADVVVTIGGVSVGTRDFVRDALVEAGVTLEFWRVALKPGGPSAFGVGPGDRLVLALPGNPVSALVTFELFVRPALLRMGGRVNVYRPRLRARLAGAAEGREGKACYLRARLAREADGWRAEVLPRQGSADLATLVQANALAVVPADRGALPEGAEVDVLPLSAEALDAPMEAGR